MSHHLSTASVRLQRFTRSFGGRAVLDGLDLDIPPGQFVALLGESGSGKTTLLRALAGLDGHAQSSGAASAQGNVSVLFQDARLLPWLSVLDNLTLGLDARASRPAAEQILREVGLHDKADAWPATLSGGQKQRAALARSLLRAPHVLLADEPFGALDALTRMRMHGLLLRLVERIRPTVILVTHDVDESLLLADRILVLRHGKIAEDHAVDLPHPRRPDHPVFMRLRTTLLHSLGVETEPA
ncbi:Aliphatic sulfonates import ATP-binding protein SsuB [Delftia tsuruhatensis]|uniref:ABC transporter ATP-binding protein n=1 Tax=Delftia tsuruhatensis TaxID=180282 RepID=UPI001E7A555F|nr:ABC transporter ATP-binding protein [Delftia tsuruhatensis]CAB5721896.1 Aliphatic sulfonates import ATP-binding protein SsuB [Delftia tsuruhatensis]CAC9681893.1 Aliphatic sulfonates import ATP-binding protein SsuB [Delftia tsuruhatensis]